MTESPTIVCPACQKQYPLRPKLIGKKVKCRCGTEFVAAAEKVPAVDPTVDDREPPWGSQPFPENLVWDNPCLPANPTRSNVSTEPPSRESAARKVDSEQLKNETDFPWRQQALFVGSTFLLLGVGNMICLQFGLSFQVLSELGADSVAASLMLACAGGVLLLAAQIREKAHFILATAITGIFLAGAVMYQIFPSPATGRRQTQRTRQKMGEERAANAAKEQQLREQRDAERTRTKTADRRPREREWTHAERLRAYKERLLESSRNAKDDSQLTHVVGGSGGGDYLYVDEALHPVLGFFYATESFDGPVLSEFLPIYDREILEQDDPAIIARPGYFVSGVRVNADEYVRAVKVTFARLVGGRLDLADSYEAEWIGKNIGATNQVLGNNGSLVVGIYGGQGLILDSLGLVLAAK